MTDNNLISIDSFFSALVQSFEYQNELKDYLKNDKKKKNRCNSLWHITSETLPRKIQNIERYKHKNLNINASLLDIIGHLQTHNPIIKVLIVHEHNYIYRLNRCCQKLKKDMLKKYRTLCIFLDDVQELGNGTIDDFVYKSTLNKLFGNNKSTLDPIHKTQFFNDIDKFISIIIIIQNINQFNAKSIQTNHFSVIGTYNKQYRRNLPNNTNSFIKISIYSIRNLPYIPENTPDNALPVSPNVSPHSQEPHLREPSPNVSPHSREPSPLEPDIVPNLFPNPPAIPPNTLFASPSDIYEQQNNNARNNNLYETIMANNVLTIISIMYICNSINLGLFIWLLINTKPKQKIKALTTTFTILAIIAILCGIIWGILSDNVNVYIIITVNVIINLSAIIYLFAKK